MKHPIAITVTIASAIAFALAIKKMYEENKNNVPEDKQVFWTAPVGAFSMLTLIAGIVVITTKSKV